MVAASRAFCTAAGIVVFDSGTLKLNWLYSGALSMNGSTIAPQANPVPPSPAAPAVSGTPSQMPRNC